MNRSTLAAPLLALPMLLTGCTVDVDDENVGRNAQAATQSDVVDVTIVEVGYGGTGYHNGEKIIFPEYFVLQNNGTKSAKIGGWYLSDGYSWGGDGVARFPAGTSIAPGETITVANHPPVTNFESLYGYQQVSFETAYGYEPDLEIGGWEPSIKDLDLVRGRIRLKHRDCDYEGNCVEVQEPVMLIDGTDLSDEDVVFLLETESLPEESIASSFPE